MSNTCLSTFTFAFPGSDTLMNVSRDSDVTINLHSHSWR